MNQVPVAVNMPGADQQVIQEKWVYDGQQQ